MTYSTFYLVIFFLVGLYVFATRIQRNIIEKQKTQIQDLERKLLSVSGENKLHKEEREDLLSKLEMLEETLSRAGVTPDVYDGTDPVIDDEAKP